jgi:hypothetical protein
VAITEWANAYPCDTYPEAWTDTAGVVHNTTSTRLIALLFNSLSWFFGFVHAKDQGEVDPTQYEQARSVLLGCMAAVQADLTMALHYLTNHMWEDFLNWGPLYFLLCEAYEASHARDRGVSAATCRGAEGASHTWNSWAVMLRNNCAKLFLTRNGTLALCVARRRRCHFLSSESNTFLFSTGSQRISARSSWEAGTGWRSCLEEMKMTNKDRF